MLSIPVTLNSGNSIAIGTQGNPPPQPISRISPAVILYFSKNNAKIDEIITYTLPLDEVFERNLIIISKQP